MNTLFNCNQELFLLFPSLWPRMVRQPKVFRRKKYDWSGVVDGYCLGAALWTGAT